MLSSVPLRDGAVLMLSMVPADGGPLGLPVGATAGQVAVVRGARNRPVTAVNLLAQQCSPLWTTDEQCTGDAVDLNTGEWVRPACGGRSSG